MTDRPDFGPPGYLPERAAKRARKIMLRQPLGVTWVVASVVAAVVLVGVGVAYVVAVTGPPGEPFTEVAPVDDIDARGSEVFTIGGDEILVVRGAGGVQAFVAPPGPPAAWCVDSRRIEAPDGRVWEVSGRLVGGEGASLARLPVEAHDGVLYVDPTSPAEPPGPGEAEEDPACHPG